MIVASTFDDFRRRVLAHEGLDDPASFRKTDFFDEIPLYSRYEQIEPFLRRGRSADSFLLDMALEYLGEVFDAATTARGFFAAITIPDDKEAKYIVPSVFVCKGRSRRRLRGLRLRKPLTEFGKRISGMLRRADPQSELEILEDTLTVPGVTRVFISNRETLGQLVHAGRD